MRLHSVDLRRQAAHRHVCMRGVWRSRVGRAQGTSLRVLRWLRVIQLAMALEGSRRIELLLQLVVLYCRISLMMLCWKCDCLHFRRMGWQCHSWHNHRTGFPAHHIFLRAVGISVSCGIYGG